jgi:hypothetical protein
MTNFRTVFSLMINKPLKNKCEQLRLMRICRFKQMVWLHDVRPQLHFLFRLLFFPPQRPRHLRGQHGILSRVYRGRTVKSATPVHPSWHGYRNNLHSHRFKNPNRLALNAGLQEDVCLAMNTMKIFLLFFLASSPEKNSVNNVTNEV